MGRIYPPSARAGSVLLSGGRLRARLIVVRTALSPILKTNAKTLDVCPNSCSRIITRARASWLVLVDLRTYGLGITSLP